MFFRTDMAVERRDLYRTANKLEDEIKGIECEEEKIDDITITRVKITNEDGERALDSHQPVPSGSTQVLYSSQCRISA